MTTSRVVRGTKGRIFLYVSVVLIITGVIACYNNTLSKLDDVQKSNERCQQQQENISTQLQVIFEYKQNLEKTLKSEKAEHQQIKKDLETKLSDEKTHNEKTASEGKLRFSSLQQHYNILQSRHDDFKEECSKIQHQQLDEINTLQSKLKEIQGQLKQLTSDRDNSLEHLKSQFLQLQIEKNNLEQQFKGTQSNNAFSESEINHLTKINHELQREITQLKAQCHISQSHYETLLEPHKSHFIVPTKLTVSSSTNFSKLAKMGEYAYQIRDYQNIPLDTKLTNISTSSSKPNEIALQNVGQVAAPRLEKGDENDQYNNQENVLAIPNSGRVVHDQHVKSSTQSSVKSPSKGSLDGVQPLKLPTVTPESLKKQPSQESRVINHDPHVLPLPYAQRIPIGVVPVPNQALHAGDELRPPQRGLQKTENTDNRLIPDDVNDALPNRYRVNIIDNEIANEDKAIKAEKQDQLNEQNKETKNLLKFDVGDKENNALEVFDSPLHNGKQVMGDFGIDDLHNDKVHIKHVQREIPKHAPVIEDGKINPGKLYDGQDGGDYDKDVQNDVQLEENDPEAEDDDADDYGDHIARQKEPAVRN